MKVCVVTQTPAESVASLPPCDIVLFGFPCLGEVNYENELKGNSDKLEACARLTKQGCGGVFACQTAGRGIRRVSAAVCDGGKLLGICDMTRVLDNDPFQSGVGLGVYTLRGYRVGVCLENDLYFPEVFKVFAECGCQLICVACKNVESQTQPLLIRAYSYLYGVPVVMCAGNLACFAGTGGGVVTCSQGVSLFEWSRQKQHRLVGTRIAGIRKAEFDDY